MTGPRGGRYINTPSGKEYIKDEELGAAKEALAKLHEQRAAKRRAARTMPAKSASDSPDGMKPKAASEPKAARPKWGSPDIKAADLQGPPKLYEPPKADLPPLLSVQGRGMPPARTLDKLAFSLAEQFGVKDRALGVSAIVDPWSNPDYAVMTFSGTPNGLYNSAAREISVTEGVEESLRTLEKWKKDNPGKKLHPYDTYLDVGGDLRGDSKGTLGPGDAIKLVAHETLHAASANVGAKSLESLTYDMDAREAYFLLEEASTEILAQHVTPEFAKYFGVEFEGVDRLWMFKSMDKPAGVTTQATGEPQKHPGVFGKLSYQSYINAFADMAYMTMDKFSKQGLQDTATNLAAHVKGTHWNVAWDAISDILLSKMEEDNGPLKDMPVLKTRTRHVAIDALSYELKNRAFRLGGPENYWSDVLAGKEEASPKAKRAELWKALQSHLDVREANAKSWET